jgi:hypothetical protein
MDFDTSTLITMCNSKIVALFSLDTLFNLCNAINALPIRAEYLKLQFKHCLFHVGYLF